MNKKNLSVVMAGAMLATSVAPVLAEETTTVNKYELPGDQVGTLIAGLRDKMDNGPKFHNNDANTTLAGESVYYIKINGAKKTLNDLKNVKTGDVVTVWDYGHRTDAYGNVFSTEETGTEGKAETYATEQELVDAFNEIAESSAQATLNTSKVISAEKNEIKTGTGDGKYPTLKSLEYDADKDTVTVLTGGNAEFVLKVGSDKLLFDKPLDKNGVALKNDVAYSQEVVNYETKKDTSGSAGKDIADVKLEEITITSSANGYNVSDLYDGLMLTEEGHNLLSKVKESYANQTTDVKYYKLDGKSVISSAETADPDSSFGIYGFVVEYKDNFKNTRKYTITGSNKAETKTLLNWLASRDPKVDLFAGSNRYETAVTVAKDVAGFDKLGANQASNIVLVNGNSLVDGLSAAPLAASLTINNGTKGAPILLTEAGKLPTATKNYLKELVDKTTEIGNVSKITINIVGGKAVVSKEVETELKNMGFSVNRVAGDNREETSLAVMKEIANQTNDNVFVVGANGEADAMSIAPVASKTNTEATPIVVAKNGGISEDALEALEGKNVTVVGGNKVVTDAEYAAIESVAKNTQRIAGSDRKATNAAIIKEFYTGNVGSGTVLIAKDGQNNKSELIDSLSATILASKNNAPIVLATNKLTNEQINNVELATAASLTNAKVYQIGHGVNESIVRSIAQAVGLVK